MMLGVLLARAGIPVVVLEKHADFLRDFRGDTVHPSTLELMHELGVLDGFLKLPHSEMREIRGVIDDVAVTIADFSHLPVQCPFIAMVPQWDLLTFLVNLARLRYRTFRLMMKAEVTELIERDGRIAGVRVETPDGMQDVLADLVVGADGRGSIVRRLARMGIEDVGAPIDALWMRLSKRPSDDTLAAFGELKRAGLDTVRAGIVEVVPFLADRVHELASWSDVKLLTVKIDRLRQWHRPGLICIGDAAHAMSPVGGVGINLAIQDAVAAANLLWQPLQRRHPESRGDRE